MDYFYDVFISFLDKDSILYTFSLAVEEQKAPGLSLKYLTGLERHKGAHNYSHLCHNNV